MKTTCKHDAAAEKLKTDGNILDFLLNQTACDCPKCAAEKAAKAAAEKKQAKQAARTARCKRCGGTGFIMSYAHIQGGRCFACTI